MFGDIDGLYNELRSRIYTSKIQNTFVANKTELHILFSPKR